MKNSTITATFVRRRLYETTRDSDYYIYEFTNISDAKGKKYPDKWVKETKLMGRVPFKKGKQYEITLSPDRDWMQSINLPFPVGVSWDGKRVYLENGNAIISVDETGKKTNHSIPWTKKLGIDNYNSDKALLNKFQKGLLSEDNILKANANGKYLYIHYFDPQDKRKSKQCVLGFSTNEKGNYILIQKETTEEIQKDLKSIKERYISKSIEKYFKIQKELLPKRK